MSRGTFEDRQNMTRPLDSYSSSEKFFVLFCSESNKIHANVFCSLKPPVGPHAFSVFASLGFGLPRVTKAEVRQRVQNPPPGPPPDPGDGCRERAQGSDGRAHAGDRGLAAEHLHAAGTQLAGQQHRRYSPQEEEGQSTHTHACRVDSKRHISGPRIEYPNSAWARVSFRMCSLCSCVSVTV